MSRTGWISVESRETLPLEVVQDLLQEAHAIVAAKLPKRLRAEFGI